MHYVFVLIHGTFARRATWIDPGSSFSRSIRQEFGADVKIVPFSWDGRNSARRRREASQSLASLLHSLFRDDPEARYVLIGHSHGGTVAINALHDPECSQRVRDVICLSTPFLHFRRRVDLDNTAGSAATAVFAAALLILCTPMFYVLGPKSVLAWVTAPLLIVAALSLQRKIVNFLTDEAAVQRRINDLRLPSLHGRRLLLVRTAGDEASGILAVGRTISWLSNRASLIWESIGAAVFNLLVIASVLVLFSAAVYAFARSGFPLALWTLLLGLSALVPLYWLSIVVVVIVISALDVPFALAHLALWVHGTDLLRVFAALEVSAEDTPPGAWSVHNLSFAENEGLLHSVGYEHAAVPPLIRRWVMGKEGAGPALDSPTRSGWKATV
jgi:pimeloyl-ACP methyl ester carboxylesterase